MELAELNSARATEPAAYFESLRAAHAAAEVRAGLVEHTIAVGPWTLRLRFAGEALVADVLPFFARVSAGPPLRHDMTICLFDGGSTGIGAPPIKSPTRPRGEVEGYNDDRFGTMFGGDRATGSPSINMFDRRTQTGVHWVPDRSRVPSWDRAAPLRAMMNFAVRGEHHQLAHGAVVGNDTGAAMLAAPGGSGKSTTTLACLQGGMKTVGDDYVAVAVRPRPRAFAVWSTATAEHEALARLPEITAPVGEGPAKVVFRVHERWPGQLVDELPLRAVLVPIRSGAPRTRAEPLSPAAALMSIAAPTALQFPQDIQALARLGELPRALPCYRLHLGPDPSEVAEAIRVLLAEVSG